MTNPGQLEQRVIRMEEIFNRGRLAVDNLLSAAQTYDDQAGALRELEAYYTSPQWLADRDADRDGLLPPDLRRGILSEDAVFDLLTDIGRMNTLLEQLIQSDSVPAHQEER